LYSESHAEFLLELLFSGSQISFKGVLVSYFHLSTTISSLHNKKKSLEVVAFASQRARAEWTNPVYKIKKTDYSTLPNDNK